MTGRRPTPGDVLDELIQNPRRLGIAHACLGLAAAVVYWVRPGAFTPHLAKYNLQDPGPVIETFLSWIPYVVAFLVSKTTLANRNPKAVAAYIFLATIVTMSASAFYLNVFGVNAAFSPVVMAIGVTVALLAAIGLCAVIWRGDTNVP
jgi:hypothetical protein